MRLFGIKNCGSVKKARDFLDSRGIGYDFIDLKVEAPEIKTIQKWVDKKGIDIVLNSKGSTYKNLGIKSLNLDLSAKIQYCHDNPMLLKRPIIDNSGDDDVLIGFDEMKYKEIFA